MWSVDKTRGWNFKSTHYYKIIRYGAGEMIQWLRLVTALAEDSDSIPSTHRVAHNRL